VIVEDLGLVGEMAKVGQTRREEDSTFREEVFDLREVEEVGTEGIEVGGFCEREREWFSEID